MFCEDCPRRDSCSEICSELEQHLPKTKNNPTNEILTDKPELYELMFRKDILGTNGFPHARFPDFKEPLMEVLEAALQELTPKQRNALHQLFYEEKSRGEFSAESGRKKSATSRLVERALENLKEIIDRKLDELEGFC